MQELATFEVHVVESNYFIARGPQQPAPDIDILVVLLKRLSQNRNAKSSEGLREENQGLGE